jgi:4-hydroxybenzoate polyprenyltransferase
MSTETAVLRAPRGTRAGRLADFLNVMFPPLVYIPYGAATFFSIYLSTQAAVAPAALRVTWRAAAGAATYVLLLLLLRVYDELKDVETDLRLGKAGDPRYKDRPIVTGRVEVGDLVFLRWLITALLFALNLPLGAPLPLAGFLVVFAFAWGSFKWFFWPAISKNLLLAFATHNPLTLLLAVYAMGVFAAELGATAVPAAAPWILCAAWFPIAAWETSRKVRCPEDETDYQTYSKMLGHRVAGLLPALFVVLATACLVLVARAAGLGWAFPAIVVAVGAAVVGACVRFVVRPTTRGANLRPITEAFGLVATVGLTVALVVTRGVVLGGP